MGCIGKRRKRAAQISGGQQVNTPYLRPESFKGLESDNFPITPIRSGLVFTVSTERLIREAHNRRASHVWQHSLCSRARTMQVCPCAASSSAIPACSSWARTLVPGLSLFSCDGRLGSICKHGAVPPMGKTHHISKSCTCVRFGSLRLLPLNT